MTKVDVIIVGGGSGGIGAAWAAAKCGARVLLAEKNPIIGGTFTSAGVSCWEAAVGGTGLAELIFREASRQANAVDIYPHLWKSPEYDLSLKVNGLDLHDRVSDPFYNTWLPDERFIKGRYGVIMEPDIYLTIVRRLLAETGKCQILCDCPLIGVSAADKAINSITLKINGAPAEIQAPCFIDATGNALLAEMAGCAMVSGAESQNCYQEQHAPAQPLPNRRNGATLIFRITPHKEKWLIRPDWTRGLGRQRPRLRLWMRRFPNDDWNVNQLPTLNGEELGSLSVAEAYKEAICRTWNYWDEFREKHPAFADFGIRWIAPELGIREGPRIIGEYVLTENDILDGIDRHKYQDIIALADHLLDMHGVHLPDLQLLKKPYGIPFRSLIPIGWNNLLVACRGAGFSQLAASSCRLSRTMMQLGQAAGTAAAMAIRQSIPANTMDYRKVQSLLSRQGVVLDGDTAECRHQQALTAYAKY